MWPNIGMRMMFVRESLNINQEGLASILDMSRSNVSAIENSRVSPSLSTICSLCLLFNIYADWLILGVGEDPDKEHLSEFFNIFNNDITKLKPLMPREYVQSCIHMFSTKLKLHRKELKLTQEDITKKLGIPRTSYIEIEKGRSSTTADVLSILLKGMEISADWLLFNIKPEERGIVFPRDKHLMLYKNKQICGFNSNNKDLNLEEVLASGVISVSSLSKEQVNTLIDLVNQYQRYNSQLNKNKSAFEN
jgi:transcriptional regulator with XRE-family HTH domain